MNYGSGLSMEAGYDARLRPSSFEVEGRAPQYGPSRVMRSDYAYYADGAVRFAADGVASGLDRAYSYDHAGRLKEAYAGRQARDFHLQGVSSTQGGEDVPYRQTHGYDAWGNLTSRGNWFWERPDTHTASYTNGRRVAQGWGGHRFSVVCGHISGACNRPPNGTSPGTDGDVG